MTCPDCERYKTSASMWRNKAYEASGHPLPWDIEELLEKAIRSEREACAKVCEEGIANADDWNSAHWDQACENRAWAIRAREQA